MRRYAGIIVLIVMGFWASVFAEEEKKHLIVVAGAGPSTEIVKLFMKEFSKLPASRGYKFGVPLKSIKHFGGIKWSDTNLFGRTGRPLNRKEKKMSKGELFLAKIPIAFAVGTDAGITALKLSQLEGIFNGQISNWQQVGGSNANINILGRETTEAMFTALKRNYPFFEHVQFQKIYRKDHHIVNILRSRQGRHAIGFGAKPNFKNANIITVDGLSVGVNVGLVYDLNNENHPLIRTAVSFAKSDEWRKMVAKEPNFLYPN